MLKWKRLPRSYSKNWASLHNNAITELSGPVYRPARLLRDICMPITYADAERTLIAGGYVPLHETTKVKGFSRGSSVMYLKKPKLGNDAVRQPLVVHADDVTAFNKLMSIAGVERSKSRSKFYHNANMRAFGKRTNNGQQPTRFGVDFDFSSPAAMSSFLRTIR